MGFGDTVPNLWAVAVTCWQQTQWGRGAARETTLASDSPQTMDTGSRLGFFTAMEMGE